MEKAKAAVGGFLSKDGKHDTTVHETVNPAVQNETVTRTQHENAQTAVDREVHQDHYHTSVQPIQDKEVLPEKHTHQMAGVEHRKINHGDDSKIKERLAAEQAQFKNTRTVGDVHHTASANPTIAGEHVHHHVHENIQPVIQKETIQPSVVHTTIPVHEVHQNEAKHHAATQLPPVSMDEFKRQGGSISGREERTDAFSGEPKATGGVLGGHGAAGTTSLTDRDGKHGHGSHDSHDVDGKKPSLMDKLNPKTDANHDGKAGIMSHHISLRRTTQPHFQFPSAKIEAIHGSTKLLASIYSTLRHATNSLPLSNPSNTSPLSVLCMP